MCLIGWWFVVICGEFGVVAWFCCFSGFLVGFGVSLLLECLLVRFGVSC